MFFSICYAEIYPPPGGVNDCNRFEFKMHIYFSYRDTIYLNVNKWYT